MNNQTVSHFLKDFYWTLPFITFLAGYQVFNLFYKTHVIETPHLVGKQIHEAMALLSHSKMNARLIMQKEDADLPEGTILSQIPSPGQSIKPHQTLFLVASKQPLKKATPVLCNRFYNDIIPFLKEHKIRHKAFFIETNHPEGLCIGQIPEAGKPLEKGGVTLYFAIDSNAQALFPDLHGVAVTHVKEFLQQYGITPTLFHINTISEHHQCTHCTVKEQKPLAGSFINSKKPFSVQLKVS